MPVWKPLAVMVLLAGAVFGVWYATGAIDFVTRCSITGTVTRDGKPLASPEGGCLLVVFVPDDRRRGKRYPATTQAATAQYRVGDVPTGRYTVSVEQLDAGNKDILRGRFGPGRTPIGVDVTHDGQVIDIDVPE